MLYYKTLHLYDNKNGMILVQKPQIYHKSHEFSEIDISMWCVVEEKEELLMWFCPRLVRYKSPPAALWAKVVSPSLGFMSKMWLTETRLKTSDQSYTVMATVCFGQSKCCCFKRKKKTVASIICFLSKCFICAKMGLGISG